MSLWGPRCLRQAALRHDATAGRLPTCCGLGRERSAEPLCDDCLTDETVVKR